MTIVTETKVWTDAEFMALPDDGGRYELVDGEVRTIGNSGMEHGNIGTFLGGALEFYVRPRKLGITCDSSTAFTLRSENKRSPDVSFISKERLKGVKRIPKGFFQGAPDLAVEVISPSNTFAELHEKLVEYFDNGCRLVWVVNPDERSILVYRQPEPDKLLKIIDTLDGEDIIPGFTLPVAELFAEFDF
ncbi:MAG: Uma2 family endonuclease [Leptolyngbyaceae cyanobacterium RU_5_1]|nr:Uma2 family endonuclease [Leptolyngbyaceae cyanobacterium RU_5_1]